jgi:glycosyltransferase involved in cell wall biosynthesis
MRIAQIAPLQVAVPPHGYGGTERVIYNLTEALVRLGHEVTLYATGDSHTSACLKAAIEQAIRFSPAVDAVALHMALLAQVYREADQFDVIHSHLDYLTLPFIAATSTPTVLTLHGRLDQPEIARLLRTYRDANYVAVSAAQQRYLPDLRWVATIYHGVDVRRFRYRVVPGTYLAFVGRISPEKGPERAIRIARMAGIPLKLAAIIEPKDEDYFHAVIEPMLDPPQIELLGELDEAGKQELLSSALALLLPIDWPEPFGMVFIEALACGTPVLTCPQGSVPELLCDGVTGYIRPTDGELAAAAQNVASISRAGCRAYVEQRFDIRRMASEYVHVYGNLRSGDRLFDSEQWESLRTA